MKYNGQCLRCKYRKFVEFYNEPAIWCTAIEGYILHDNKACTVFTERDKDLEMNEYYDEQL